jgi:lysophospholipase L1-like esterase
MEQNREQLTYRSCILIGDSHISRLYDSLSERGSIIDPRDFGIPGAMITFRGKGGKTIPLAVQGDVSFIRDSRPDIVFIHVGGNDLTQHRNSPGWVAHELIKLAAEVLKYAQHVVISSICFRHQSRKYAIPANFQSQCKKTNMLLTKQSRAQDRIHLWNHKFSCSAQNMVDGVHFTQATEVRFARSIQSCLALVLRNKLTWSHVKKLKND